MAKKDAYPREYKQRAVAPYRSSGRSKLDIARELGISPTSLYNWVHRADVDAGEVVGVTTDDQVCQEIGVSDLEGCGRPESVVCPPDLAPTGRGNALKEGCQPREFAL